MAKKRHNGSLALVSVAGEIRAADLDDGTFVLRLADGRRVQGKFSRGQGGVITEALREHASRRLHVRGRGEVQPNGNLKRLVSVKHLDVRQAGPKREPNQSKPFWKWIVELGESIPKEEWAKVPTDLSKNLDHYLYGAPKVKKSNGSSRTLDTGSHCFI